VLTVYGGSTAYADRMLALAAPATTSNLPVALPIPAPGWVQRIATPAWPSDLAAHMSPSAVTNQRVAGAFATWALMHVGDPRWDHPPPLFGNAIDLFGVARAQGFQVSRQPMVGSMVVYCSAYGHFGHFATVVAVEPGRCEVVEQNFLDFNPNLESHWGTFDLRTVSRLHDGVWHSIKFQGSRAESAVGWSADPQRAPERESSATRAR
jgi:surface antigen